MEQTENQYVRDDCMDLDDENYEVDDTERCYEDDGGYDCEYDCGADVHGDLDPSADSCYCEDIGGHGYDLDDGYFYYESDYSS